MDARLPAFALLGLSLVSACDEPAKPAPDPAQTAPATPAQTPDSATETAKDGGHPLLAWLDPDAVALVYLKRSIPVDPEAFATAFAMPPKLSRMLRDVPAVVEGLDAIHDDADPDPDTWFGPEALASTSRVSSGTYVLHTLALPRADVESYLQHASMRADEYEGVTVYMPQGPFPWKVAFLDDTVVAFVPVKEIGSGLSPLTAGRDLPASRAEQDLQTVLKNEPNALLEAVEAGPVMHLDLEQDLAQFAVSARPFQGRGLEVAVRLAPLEDATKAAASLRDRDLSLETDALAALAKKVAFTVEGPLVVGRLQATPDDARTLGDG